MTNSIVNMVDPSGENPLAILIGLGFLVVGAAAILAVSYINPCAFPNYHQADCDALKDLCLAPFRAIDRVLNPPQTIPDELYDPDRIRMQREGEEAQRRPQPERQPVPPLQPIPTPDNDEEDCDEHLTDDAAAIAYARISRDIYESVLSLARLRGVTNAERKIATFSIAFTRVRDRQTKQCVGVGASSFLYGEMSNPTRNNQYWRNIITDSLLQSSEVNIGVPVISGMVPSFGAGHAETNIHNFVTLGNFAGYRAMGTSNPKGPCESGPGGANCQAFFSAVGIPIGYIGRDNSLNVFRKGNSPRSS